jgi:SAM-dependent methyltransferase
MLEVFAAVATQGRDERSRYFLSAEMPALLRERAQAAPPAVLVDLGAGEGAILYALLAARLARGQMYAVDLSADALAVAARVVPGVVTFVSDVTHVTELRDGEADAVVSSQVIEHLPDDRALAAEIARLLRPGGWFYVSSVIRGRRAWWFRRGALGRQLDPTHVREYASEGAFLEALRHPQLVVEEVRSRPLRFSVADPLVRVAAARGLVRGDALATVFERNRSLAIARKLARVRVPGYRWVEAVGRRDT